MMVDEHSRSAKTEWRSANDSKSGRVYYYNVRTKETTWNKPLELASPAEQREMIAKKNATLKFFREMEENIKRKALGLADPPLSPRKTKSDNIYDSMPKNRSNSIDRDDSKIIYENRDLLAGYEGRGRLNSFGGGPPRRIRTISTMDDEILLTMHQSNGADRKNTLYNKSKMQSVEEEQSKRASPQVPATVPYRVRTGSNDFPNEMPLPLKINSNDIVIEEDDKPATSKKARSNKKTVTNKRRNSTGTIYLSATMSKQDNNATIQCVCIVIRAHMIDAAREKSVPISAYDVFKDVAYVNSSLDRGDKEHYNLSLIPSLATVKDFFTHIFSKSQLESDCIIMALIYCERLVKETKGRLCIRYDNWRSILFACLVMASKVWDDLSMWNVDFSHVYPSFDLQRVNALELAMLDALKYVIRVSASEYAKYYFHLRSMIPRLGLDGGGDSNAIKPLDVMGARKLQLSTEKYQALSSDTAPRRRHNSVYANNVERQHSEGGAAVYSHSSIGLEQIISDQHIDAGGQVKSKASSPVKTPNPMSRSSGIALTPRDPHK